jgi:PAS domain-containing protein
MTLSNFDEGARRYEAALRASGHILYDWDPRTNELTWGGNLEYTLGYTSDELAGGLSRWIELIHHDDRPAFEAKPRAASPRLVIAPACSTGSATKTDVTAM